VICSFEGTYRALPGWPIETQWSTHYSQSSLPASGGGRSTFVATDQKISAIHTEQVASESVIENEIPTYRAISARAIFSVAFGALSACSFAHPFFYVFVILAIGFGIWAHLKIKQLPDILTGKGLANAGIGMGLVFGLASGTVSTVEYLVRQRQATLFAKSYVEVLKRADLPEMLWYNAHPDLRKGKTAAQIMEELDSKPQERKMMEMSLGPLAQMMRLQRRLSSTKGQNVRFIRIAAVGEEAGNSMELKIYALALYEIDGPPSEKFPEAREYALAVLKARPVGRVYEWWVQEVMYPYTNQTYSPAEQPVGDSHGHGEGGHSH
jgi:hypothetical protein